MLVLAQGAQDGVGRAAHAALQGQELLGYAAGVQLAHEELGGEEANLVSHGGAVLEGAGLVGNVALHDAHHLLAGDADVGLADAVADVEDGNGLAVGRVQGLIHVVYVLGVGAVEVVQLQYDVLGQAGCRGADATGGGEVNT